MAEYLTVPTKALPSFVTEHKAGRMLNHTKGSEVALGSLEYEIYKYSHMQSTRE